MFRSVPQLGCAAVVLALASGAIAQEAPTDMSPGDDFDLMEAYADSGYVATGRVERGIPGDTELDPTATATAIRLEDRPIAGETARDVLAEVPGAQVRSRGGPGQFTGVSLWGAESQHTTVVLDRLVIHGPDDGAFDFSLLPLSAFSSIEVFRGGAPAVLDVAPMGGTVRLLPRFGQGRQVGFTADYGSFRTGGATAHVSAGDFDTNVFGVVGVRGSAGDFTFLDDGNTRFDYTDDVTRRRENADVLDAHTMLALRVHPGRGDWEVDAVLLGISRLAGAPGPASAPALQARIRRQQLRLILGAGRDFDGRFPTRFAFATSVSTRRRSFYDALGEIGLGRQDIDDTTRGWSARAHATTTWHDNLESTVVLSARGFRYSSYDPFARFQDGVSRRETLSATAELHAHGALGPVSFSVRPSVRVLGAFGRLRDNDDNRRERTFDAREVVPTYRLGVAASPVRGFAITGAVYRGTRLPSLLELFGDRTVLLPNAELTPETGFGGDAGLRLSDTYGPICIRAEARGFARRIDDLIRYRRTSQFQAVAENAGSGRIRGFEAGLEFAWERYVRLGVSLSLLDPRDDDGRVLPLRSRRRAFGRLTLGTGDLLGDFELRAFGDLRHQASVFADPANLIVVPGRTWISVGAGVGFRGLRVDFTTRDVGDQAGFDLLGFPLPGRRYSVMLTYQKDWT